MPCWPLHLCVLVPLVFPAVDVVGTLNKSGCSYCLVYCPAFCFGNKSKQILAVLTHRNVRVCPANDLCSPKREQSRRVRATW